MKNVLHWDWKRAFHDDSFLIFFAVLIALGVFFSEAANGRLSQSALRTMDLSSLNMAFGANCATREDFLAYYVKNRYYQVVSAYGQMWAFSIAGMLFPSFQSSEIQLPISIGLSRFKVYGAAILKYFTLICFISVAILGIGGYDCFLTTSSFPVSYYVRTLFLHIYLDLGYASLALFLTLLFPQRFVGACVSFFLIFVLFFLRGAGYFNNTFLASLFGTISFNGAEAWMWQETYSVQLFDILQVILFPPVCMFLAIMTGWLRFFKKDLLAEQN